MLNTDDQYFLNEPESNRSFSDFTDLVCYQKARDLRNTLSQLTLKFPIEEKHRLSDQIIRASRSVTNNIAEGFGRLHYRESLKFYFISRGSLSELHDHLTIALDEQYISETEFEILREMVGETTKILNGYIGYIKTKIQ